MRSILKALPLVLLLGAVLACEEDDLGFTGEFDLTIVETSDTCDEIEDTIFSHVSISGTTDDLEVRFGDDALLTGGLNSQNFFEVSGPATVEIDGVEVVSSMVLIFEVSARGRRLDVEEGSMLTFEGTHPAAPGEVCVQEFQGTGQRPSLSPVI
ncbi:MAG: hypothetical protein ACREMD_03660 [Gemmatimonadota bacterium]